MTSTRTSDRTVPTPPAPPTSGGDIQSSRLDRELMELLNELRVVLPGVQALFAFLLIVPFNERFATVGGGLRSVYVIALMASAVACVLFMAPASFHRLRFRRHDKAQLIRVGNRCAVAGLGALAVAMLASVYFVGDYLFDGHGPRLLTGSLAVAIIGLWWVVPLCFGPDGRDRADD